MIIIALFWLAAITSVRAVRRRIYRKKIEQRTLELLLADDEDNKIKREDEEDEL